MKSLFGSVCTVALITAGLTVASTASAETQTGAITTPLKAGTTFKECDDCPEMVAIPKGSFTMGAEGGEPERYEGPVREVTIAKSFAAGVIPVTYGQYRAFIKDTNYQSGVDCIIPVDGAYKAVPGLNWEDPGIGRAPRDDEPVVCIDWKDAKAYVDWVASKTGQPYRMLSEAEWEYVARAGKMARFTWGDNPEDACKHSNLMDSSAPKSVMVAGKPTECSDGFETLAPAGHYPPNDFGVRDMVGNVWSWVQDCYVMPYPAGPLDGSAYESTECPRRSVRGASWATSVSRAHPTFRGRDPEDRLSQLFGLRIARDLPNQ